MTNENYSLHELLIIFDEHEKKSILEYKRLFEEFRENYPNDPIPILENDFNLPKALKTIVKEIIEMKNEKRIKKDHK